jgi:hypothetical protein
VLVVVLLLLARLPLGRSYRRLPLGRRLLRQEKGCRGDEGPR